MLTFNILQLKVDTIYVDIRGPCCQLRPRAPQNIEPPLSLGTSKVISYFFRKKNNLKFFLGCLVGLKLLIFMESQNGGRATHSYLFVII
jgi:hypothetical protein